MFSPVADTTSSSFYPSSFTSHNLMLAPNIVNPQLRTTIPIDNKLIASPSCTENYS
jgi:hypothetical protein